jgi:predicted lipoprotein with Yx(FWY)xxD motif
VRQLTLTALAAVLLVTACGDDETSDGGTPASRPGAASAGDADPGGAGAARTPKGTEIRLRGSQFGKILFDSRRRAIYVFDKEKTERARCYGECARAWPPVYTRGRPRAGRGVDADLLGTTKRRDGRRQVTYHGHPLYFYAHEDPGEVLCHDVDEFGGLWLVVKANGDPVPSSR